MAMTACAATRAPANSLLPMTSEPIPNQCTPATGAIRDGVHVYPVRAFFEDTDLSGVVYHANYLRWFERARSDLLDQLGIDQRAAFEAGEGAFAVSELSIRYAAPARLGDTVTIATCPEQVARSSCRLRQRARRDGTLLADMAVRVAFLDPGGRPRRQPAEWLSAFADFASPQPSPTS